MPSLPEFQKEAQKLPRDSVLWWHDSRADIPGQFVSFKSQMNPLHSLPSRNYKSDAVSTDFQWTVINSMAAGITHDCFIPSGGQTHLFLTPRLQNVNEWTGTPSTTSPPPTVALPRYRTGTVDRITSALPGKTAASLMRLANCILQQQKKRREKKGRNKCEVFS